MTPKEVYDKAQPLVKSGMGISEACKKLKVPVWKYYTGRQKTLNIKYGKAKVTAPTAPVVQGASATGTKCVLIMGTPEQIREVLG